MKKVNKTTRSGAQGKDIYCPHCNSVAHVGHFSWSALQCNKCGKMQDKNNWLLEPSDCVDINAYADMYEWETSTVVKIVNKIKCKFIGLVKSFFRAKPDAKVWR